MKYKVGEKVLIKSLDWYNENKTSDFGDIDCGTMPFMNYMIEFCNRIVTISNVDSIDECYEIEEDNGLNGWTDEMIEGPVVLIEDKTNFGTALNPIKPKSNTNYITRERVNKSYISKKVLELPDNYIFKDENSEYNDNYCEVKDMGEDNEEFSDDEPEYFVINKEDISVGDYIGIECERFGGYSSHLRIVDIQQRYDGITGEPYKIVIDEEDEIWSTQSGQCLSNPNTFYEIYGYFRELK